MRQNSTRHKLFEKIESCKNYAIELQKGLTAIPAICPKNGGTGEYDKAVYLEKELKKLAFDEIKWINAPMKEAKQGIRPNIIARYKGTNSNATLWIMSHLDIVPPGERSLWKTDPYKLEVKGDKIIGRGVEDNQQAVVSGIVAVRAMMECGWRPPVDFALMFAADEETGSAYGAGYIMEKHKHLFGKNDVFIVPDAGRPDGNLVEIAEKSILWLKIRTKGKQCHASTPEMGVNSFKAASDMIVRLKSLYAKFPKKNHVFEPPISTFEPTKKEANIPNINTIPGDDVFYFDSRILPDYAIAQVMAEIRRIAAKIEKEYKVKIAISTEQETKAAPPTPVESPLVKLVTSAAKEIYRNNPKPQGIGGGTVASFFRKAGFPTVVYSKLDEVAHQPNEYCYLSDLLGDAKIWTLVAMNLN
ncbi:MAG: M20 family metallo-hydrolase [Elusimicrobia bacterium]|nr:M20 family metallo-hydrolase [Elusimicrobiota bacterium]